MHGLYKALLLTGAVGVSITLMGISNDAESTGLGSVAFTTAPGTVVSPVFTRDIGRPIENICFNIDWDFDPAYLEFRNDLATVTYDGQERGLSGFIDLVKSMFGTKPKVSSIENASTVWGSKHHNYAVFSAGFESTRLSGLPTIKAAFNLTPEVAVGQYEVAAISSNLVDVNGNEIPLSATATILEVPES